MRLTLLQMSQLLPGLLVLTRAVPPRWYFKWSLRSASMARYVYPHARRQAQPFLDLFGDRFEPAELKKRALDHLTYRRMYKEIALAWRSWEDRPEDWVSIAGEQHLTEALAAGKGVFLVSGHNYGFSRLIPPVLARKGYQVQRGGNGKKPSEREGRWGKNYELGWHYFYYQEGDYWHRVKMLRTLHRALDRNAVIHISPLNYRNGRPEMAVDFWRRKFYLDDKWFRVMEVCQAPILPCFAVGTAGGTIKIQIHPPLPAGREAMASQFGKVFLTYLQDHPEYARFWGAMLKERPWW